MSQLDLFGGKAEDCTFCKIVRGELQAHNVFEDDTTIAFLDNKPLFPGHCLLVPKKHRQTLGDLPPNEVAPLFSNAQLLSSAVERAMKAEGTFIGINNRVSQSVPHLHVHIVPRRRGDGLKGFFWPRTRYETEGAATAVQDAIKTAIDELRRG